MGQGTVTGSLVTAIIERSSSLHERLDEPFEALAHTAADEAIIDERLDRWRAVVADGDAARFRRRLALDGLDEAAARIALGPVRLRSGAPRPEWAGTLEALLGLYGAETFADGASDSWAFLQPGTPYPFEDLLAPMVAYAGERLARRMPAASRLTPAAVAALQRSLLRRLTKLSAESLFQQFHQHRARSTSSFGRFLANFSTEPESRVYQAFVAEMRSGGLARFFGIYPVLARLMTTAVDHWVDATAEFLARFDADWPDVQACLFGGREPGAVTALQADLSDAHNLGRTTLLLTFANGQKVVYKPRDLATEVNWFVLLGWLNEHGSPLPFTRLNIVDRGTHGWVEFAVHRPCGTLDEARRYYRRTGMILALVYALGGNDCHFENIVAQGDQPVLVDLETIMHPVRRDGSGALSRAIGRMRFESVLRTGMLPQWVAQSGGRALDTSALGAVNELQTTRPQPIWRAINTDAMQLDRAPMTVPPGANAAMTDGVPMSPNDYVPEIERGFREMYDLLIAERDALLAPGGPVHTMREQPVRFIFRGTGVYYAVAERANHPEALRDGAARSIELDALARPLLAEPGTPPFWPLLGIERRDLERGDIPAFVVPAGSEDLPLDGRDPIRDCLDGSCYAGAEARLRRLDARDLARQIGFIRVTMQARVARHGRGAEDALDDVASGEVEFPSPAALVEDAMELASAFERDALGDLDDGVAWMTVRLNFAMQRFHLEVSGPGLYDGAAGIALFLGMLHQVTGDPGPRALALAALAPLRSELRDGAALIGREIGIGGASGLGSCVYGLVRASALLEIPDLLESAQAAALAISPELIAEDRTFDVIGGAAGAILGLLSLYGATGDTDTLDIAVRCGQHLIDHQITDTLGQRAWQSPNGVMLAGFAHGAAGIAYALARLSVATGDGRFLSAAEAAIGYEQSLFSDAAGNWPDLREWTPGQPVTEFAESWCNGGPGIGLARLGGLNALDTPAIRAEIEAAMRIARDARGNGADHLCCGHLGRADILLETGLRLHRPDLKDAAMHRLADRRARAQARGGYRLAWETGGGVAMPGLFQGMSGIGYALLRAAYPGRFPSVLLWENDRPASD